MNKFLLVLALCIPVNSYAFDWFNDKGFYITIGDRPNPITRSVKNKYGQQYGILTSFVWFMATDASDFSDEKVTRLNLTWDF